MSLAEDLTATVKAYVSSWHKVGYFYAAVPVFLRLMLICASAVLASKLLGVKWKDDSLVGEWLSVIVGVGTAIDSWLKPRDKWKGFMADREHAEDLLMRLENAGPQEPIGRFREEFQKILEVHREKNVF